MLIEHDIFNWRMLYFAELISFLLVVLIILKKETLYHSILWAMSNLLTATSILIPSIFIDAKIYGTYSVSVYLCITFSIILPYFALAGTNRRVLPSHKTGVVASAGIIAIMAVTVFPSKWQSIVLACSGGAAILLATAWVCYKNRFWRGFNGQYIMIFGLTAFALVFLWRGWITFEARGSSDLEIDDPTIIVWLQMLIFSSFCTQMGFLNMIVSRDLRVRLFAGRRAARLFEGRLRMLAEQDRLSLLAKERFITLGLLTHEVRQPINNALAALEALNYAIEPDTPRAVKSKTAISRAQSVLDAINLAISNAIVAASFLERDEETVVQSVRAFDVADLAITDCPAEQAPRIKITWDPRVVYVDIDPLLIRLALRNLLDNALKYSPAQSAIHLDVVQRDDLLGTSFKLTSEVTTPKLLNDDIFKRRTRAASARGEGSGLGLYLVKKVADAHRGTISYMLQANAMVTFELFIPN